LTGQVTPPGNESTRERALQNRLPQPCGALKVRGRAGFQLVSHAESALDFFYNAFLL
jgi:hypothetical protein